MTKSGVAIAAIAAVLVPVSLSPATQPPSPADPPPTGVPPAPPVESPPAGPTDEELAGMFLITIRGLGETAFRTDLDDSPGSVAIYRLGTGINVDGPLTDRVRLGVTLNSELSWYDFSNATGQVPGTDDPLSEAYRLVLRPQIAVIESQQLSWFVGAILESAGEYGASFGRTLSGGGYGGVRYQFSDTFAASLGLAFKTRIEDSSLVLPLITLQWSLNETVTLSSDGLSGTLAAQLNPNWWFVASGGWELRDYRLDSDGPLPSGVVRDERVPIGVGFSYRPSRGTAIDLLGGAVVWQRYNVDDRNGDSVSRVNSDPAPFLRLSARITF